ncbi:BglG family transcription antiterminator, partial [Enterococcus sp. 12F9_DIV0723]
TRQVKSIWEQNKLGCVGFKVSYTQVDGYCLTIIEQRAFLNYIAETSYLPNNNERRISGVLDCLLKANSFLRIEKLADDFFVSRATIDRLMPQIKKIAEEYRLKLESKPHHGIRLIGDELDKRLCYAHKVATDTYRQESMTKQVQAILLEVIRKYGLVINDINFYNLVQHCVIAIRRIAEGNSLEEGGLANLPSSEPEQKAAHEITHSFETEFDIQFPLTEEQYIVLHLLGKRVLLQSQTVDTETRDCVEAVLQHIKVEKGVDLLQDKELRTALALHMQPLLLRLRFGLPQSNPVMQEIKRDMPRAFELALCASNVITTLYGLEISEEETGYLTMHFALALEQRKQSEIMQKIVVVCASGRGTARLLRHRLVESYHFKSENLIMTSIYELDDINYDGVLCILSTVPLMKQYPAPTVTIDLAMSQQSMERIDEFLVSGNIQINAKKKLALPQVCVLLPNQSLSTPREIIDVFCTALSERVSLPDDFTDQVERRETLSTTEVGNQVALPHPCEYDGEKNLLAVMSLKKPVRWKYNNVRLVILQAIPPYENNDAIQFQEDVTRLVCDQKAVTRLVRNLNFDTLQFELFGESKQ